MTPPAAHHSSAAPAAEAELERARKLGNGFLGLVALTYGLIVLGALVRAHEAGLACPDWPLCFGQLVPQMDLKVAFEWSHRAVAGGVSLIFAGLAWLALRRPHTRRASRTLLAVAAALLVAQVILGGLTVLKLLASWTVTSHLVTGNAFALTLLLTACSLRERPQAPRARWAPAAAGLVVASAGLLLLQMVLGGLVSSRFAGMACPEWPACNGGAWFPTWGGSVGLHLLHRMNAYALLLVLAAGALASRKLTGLRGITLAALGLGFAQVLVGIANVLLGIPVEVTGLHSALAAALVLTLTLAVREVWRARDRHRIASPESTRAR